MFEWNCFYLVETYHNLNEDWLFWEQELFTFIWWTIFYSLVEGYLCSFDMWQHIRDRLALFCPGYNSFNLLLGHMIVEP